MGCKVAQEFRTASWLLHTHTNHDSSTVYVCTCIVNRGTIWWPFERYVARVDHPVAREETHMQQASSSSHLMCTSMMVIQDDLLLVNLQMTHTIVTPPY